MEKKLKLLKPNNDWFVSFDYNGADVRTFLGLLGEEQPQKISMNGTQNPLR